MIEIDTFKRIFISYSREDSAFTNKLALDLQINGLAVWTDFERLVPGTPDWETALREAVDESFALLLIATPSSRKSPFVRSEILLCQAKNLPIFVVWADGDNWIDAVPMNLAYTQYIDLRNDAYNVNLLELIKELSRLGLVLPTHFLYKSFYKRVLPGEAKPKGYSVTGGFGYSGSIADVCEREHPKSYVQIRLCDQFEQLHKQSSVDVVFIKPSSYKMCIHLLAELYMNYLADRFPPFSYGERWVLVKHAFGIWQNRIVLDWNFIKNGGFCRNQADMSIWMTRKPEDYGLVSNSTWLVTDKIPENMVVVAAKDAWLIDQFAKYSKGGDDGFRFTNVLERKDINFNEFNSFSVIKTPWIDTTSDRVIVQARDISIEEKQEYDRFLELQGFPLCKQD